MALMGQGADVPASDESLTGQMPTRLTYDPTQSTGTMGWQMSLEHNRRLQQRGQEG